MTAPANFLTVNDPCLNIGGPTDLLLVGDSFERAYTWQVADPPPECCEFSPADFTGYTPTADVLDAAGLVLDTFTVTPSPGDTTGTFTVSLTSAQVDAGLAAAAVRWRLRITAGSITRTLVYALFTVTA
jgi:hypothetical protein